MRVYNINQTTNNLDHLGDCDDDEYQQYKNFGLTGKDDEHGFDTRLILTPFVDSKMEFVPALKLFGDE